MAEMIRLAAAQLANRPVVDEWLVTNGLGGYASATVRGEISRRYHGFLIAALPAPLGRIVMLSDLTTEVEGSGSGLTAENLREFSLTDGLPSWRYATAGGVIEKSALLPSHHNIVHITYRLVEGPAQVRLRLRPFVHFRRLEEPVNAALPDSYAISARGPQYEITVSPDLPKLRLIIDGDDHASFTADGGSRSEFF
jgi:glycogen debranching enzyme